MDVALWKSNKILSEPNILCATNFQTFRFIFATLQEPPFSAETKQNYKKCLENRSIKNKQIAQDIISFS